MNDLVVIALILLVPLGVWLLTFVFKGGDSAAKDARPRASGQQRRPASELDRFLEEARRRRESAERRQPAPPRPTPVAEVARPSSPRPSTRQQPQPARRPSKATPAAARATPSQHGREAAEVIKTARLAPPEPPPAPPEPTFRQPTTVQPIDIRPNESDSSSSVPAFQTEIVTPPITPNEPIAPVARRLTELLKSPQSVATAFALREVFAAPLCKRRK